MQWYENGPLKHVGKDCLESLLGEIAALPAGVTREAIRSQEEHVAMTGETAPTETGYIHKIKRGEEQLKERISEDWPTLSRSLRMKDEKTFREHYGYLYELFKNLQDEKIADVSATEVDKAPFEKLDLPGCRMLNELILGVVGDVSAAPCVVHACVLSPLPCFPFGFSAPFSAPVLRTLTKPWLCCAASERRNRISLGPWFLLAPAPRGGRRLDLGAAERGRSWHVHAASA